MCGLCPKYSTHTAPTVHYPTEIHLVIMSQHLTLLSSRSPQTFPYKLSPRTSSSPHSHTNPRWLLQCSQVPLCRHHCPSTRREPGASQRPNQKKKGNKSKQKNSPDPPITHTKEQACGKRKLPPASTRRGGRGSPHCSPSPGLVMTIPAPDRLQPPCPAASTPPLFPLWAP